MREQLRTVPSGFEQVQPPQIPKFLLFGQAVETVSAKSEPGTLINYPELSDKEQSKVRISGPISKTDWDNLINILAAPQLSPEKAFLNIELQFSTEARNDPQIRMLAEAARRFGIRFKLS
jgi:hypothetical protein